MDAAQSSFQKPFLFLATALLLSAPFPASAGSPLTLNASSTSITLGSALGCNSYQDLNLTSSGGANGPIAFSVAVNYPNGSSNGDSYGAWLYATLETGGTSGTDTTSTGSTISGTTGSSGVADLQIGLNRTFGAVSDEAQVIVTYGGSKITITVNYTQNGNCGSTGTSNNGFFSYSPTNIVVSAPVNGTATQTVTIQNISTANYVVVPSVQNPWLSVGTNPITLTPNETYNILLTASASAASNAANSSGTLVLSPATGYAGSVINIPVQFTVGGGTTTGGSTGGLTVNGAATASVTFNYVAPNTIGGNCVNLVDTTSGVTGYSWTITTLNGGNWLFGPNNSFAGSTPQILAPGTPGSPCIELTLNPAVAYSLSSGAYQGTVTVSDGEGGSATITANLYVSAGLSTGISVSPGAIYSFNNVSSSSNVEQQATFTVTAANGYNLGAPSLANSGVVFSLNSVTQNQNSLTFTVNSNSTGLTTGLYSSTITVPSNFGGGANSNTIITVVQPVGQAGSTTSGGGPTTTTVVPSSLTFQQQSGSTFWTGGKEAQALSISGPQGETWSATITYTGGTSAWLNFDNASSGTFGSGPTTLLVDLFNGVGSLAASNNVYQAYVNFTINGGSGPQVAVSVLVTPSNTAVLLGIPGSTTFSANSGANPASQTVTVLGSDNTNSNSTTTPPITAGTPTASWITATTSGNQLTLSANVGSLGTGIYSGVVPISSSAYSDSINYPVILIVNGGGGGQGGGNGPLTISPCCSLTFNVNGSSSQNLNVSASSATQYTLTTTESTCTGSTWLQVTNGGYTASASGQTIPVNVNPSGISNGTTCSGTITFSSGSNSQTVNVTMTVNGSSGSGNVTVSPTSLSFPYTQGQSAPAAQTVTIVNTNSGTASIPFSVGTTESNGTSTQWLLTGGITSAQTPYNSPGLSISVAPGTLPPNTYTGTVTITPNGGAAVTINVTMTISATATVTASPTSVSWTYMVGTTAPTATIAVTAGGAVANFTATASSTGGWLQVSPISGSTPNNGSQNLTVSTVASALAALSPQTTPYTGTITVQGVPQGNSQATGTTIINVSLTVTAPLPVISDIINAASGVGGASNVSVSPGEIISLFAPNNGQNPFGPSTPVQLNSTTCPGTCTSVPTSMGGVQVIFLPGNFAAPLLYVSSNQINAVVPYQVAGIGGLTVEVKYLNQSSNAFPLNVVTTSPGLFQVPGSQQIAAYEYDAHGNPVNYNSSAAPATTGWILEIFVTGEGAVIPSAASGAVTAVSSQTPVPAAGKPNVLIGNQPATLQFYGEAPGFVSGLMQLNVIVPPGAGSGAVPISVTIGGNSTQSGATVYLQ